MTAPQLEAPMIPLPVVEENREESVPLQSGSTVRSPSRRLWKGMQQVQIIYQLFQQDNHMHCFHSAFFFFFLFGRLSLDPSLHQVRPQPPPADQSWEGRHLLSGQNEQGYMQGPQHIHLQDQQGR